ncbi:triple tyrosine motif-containing protein [Clostridium oryzae]|uniref:Two component regulator three Y domain-containing protein n=1 Tax=Clostridium oryzae TaxID=1450648 RepID=A0A1V4IWN0_9CLOT|nr:triple tyrosine motif-containing protein [Clostridium oryzae]OPJ64185.1 hypothetical protein CLORY_07500 [Clostridium oryzae]
MEDANIVFSIPGPAEKNSKIEIKVENLHESDYLFKFMLGIDGVWNILQDFSENESTVWTPSQEGKYIIMVQMKKKDSVKPFDKVLRSDYIIGRIEENIIDSLEIDKHELKVGDKLNLIVNVNKTSVVYKYWIKVEDKWEILRDYCAENTLSITAKNPGTNQLLVECRNLDSKNTFDDFKKIEFEVLPIKKLEIKNFKCLSTVMLSGEELVFQVDADYEDNRMVLYKFIKITKTGKATCIQDYSTKRMVSYIEDDHGDFKLLCMAKDMYSVEEYDDRAIIAYKVRPYEDIEIQSFTSDVMSPQICDSSIELKAVVKGGKNLLYRYIIDGNSSKDSGYINDSSFIWTPERSGEYKVTLLVKDKSSKEKFEKQTSFKYIIDDYSVNPVKIKDIILSKEDNVVVGESINIKAIATGGIDLRYSFSVKKDGIEIEKVNYGSCSWVNFTPDNEGEYEFEVRAKDKYSTKQYDSHEIIHLTARKYLPAEIDYVLMPAKENYLVGDTIRFDIIAQKTQDTLIKYVLKINSHLVEETDYIKSDRYLVNPKCSGSYVVEIMAKNKKSSEAYDDKKIINIYVNDALPVTNTKILWDKVNIKVNEPVIFSVKCEGGKDVVYEFYLMEHEDWVLSQKYSKMNYFSFIPYSSGNYKILALTKSSYKDISYEDYDMIEFNVNK